MRRVEQTFGLWRADGLFTRQWLDYFDRNEKNLIVSQYRFENPRRRLARLRLYDIRRTTQRTRLYVSEGRSDAAIFGSTMAGISPIRSGIICESISEISGSVGRRTFRFSKESREYLIRGSSFINEELLIGGASVVVGDPVCFQESSPICFTNDVMKSNRGVSWQGVHLLNLSASDTREALAHRQ